MVASAVTTQPRIVHAVPGRVRIHLPSWAGSAPRAIEARLQRLPGVKDSRANPLTGNVIIRFDPAVISQDAVLSILQEIDLAEETPVPPDRVQGPRLSVERRGPVRRVRIAVKGIEQDLALARRIEEYLHQRYRITARANPVTGRLLVEFAEGQILIEDLLDEIQALSAPAELGPELVGDPFDPVPLRIGFLRSAGAALGLVGLSVVRALRGPQAQVGSQRAGEMAAILGLIPAFPWVRAGLRHLFGPFGAELITGAASIAALSLAGSVGGLVLTMLQELRLVTAELARRNALRQFEEMANVAPAARPGKTLWLEEGDLLPLNGRVTEGYAIIQDRDGSPVAVAPGAYLAAGTMVCGGSVAVSADDIPRTAPGQPRPSLPRALDRYLAFEDITALTFAGLLGLATRAPGRALEGLVFVSPRAAVVGADIADLSATARVTRAGGIVTGVRPEHGVTKPDVVVLQSPRLLVDGFEVARVLPLQDEIRIERLHELAGAVMAAAGWPWGRVFTGIQLAAAADGTFDGEAHATIDGVPYRVRPAHRDAIPGVAQLLENGEFPLVLVSGHEQRPVALLSLQPRLAASVPQFVTTCHRLGIRVAILSPVRSPSAAAIARRAGIPLHASPSLLAAVEQEQGQGYRVALIVEAAGDEAALHVCDVGIALMRPRAETLARADILVPSLDVAAAILETGRRKDLAIRDVVALSAVANIAGGVWSLAGQRGIIQASRLGTFATLAALVIAWARHWGGAAEAPPTAFISDPQPERWARLSIPSVFEKLGTRQSGLTEHEAAQRRQQAALPSTRHPIRDALVEQLRSPLLGFLALAAGFSLALGAVLDVALIASVIGINVALSAWQEHQTNRVVDMLAHLGGAHAQVIRDGHVVTIPADEVVKGDVLYLAAGHRVAADARLIQSVGLEIDEALLTGESLPVSKTPNAASASARIVLAGTDVVAGHGLAVVVATGNETRLGAMRTTLAATPAPRSMLESRLSSMVRLVLPVALTGGALVTVAGLLRGRPLSGELALGTSIAVAAVPESLPLLARFGQSGVARRLAARKALVRNLAVTEALGRVDVACVDKTGTLTEGVLRLQLLADMNECHEPHNSMSPAFRHLLSAAAIASPHPGDMHGGAHPTDVAVVQGARRLGLAQDLTASREEESPFEPGRGFHATVVGGKLYTKGAPEVLAPRCVRVRMGNQVLFLDDEGRTKLLDRANELAGRGLRVLLVAEGPMQSPLNPDGLTALGFVGISDPLKASVATAVQHCQEAGVRVIMITGDHPLTARTIGHQAGLIDHGDVLTGPEVDDLDDERLGDRLEQAAVIARATPLHKVRIIQCLQRRGHVVSMTGDGANDGPALRLADVGVAMGSGTDVAKEAAELILLDNDFHTLVAALIEGRAFWRNIRRAVGLLLGGNLGELGLLILPALTGLAPPLNTRQILAVNMLSDILPSLTVTLERPRQRQLSVYAREGAARSETLLRQEVFCRGLATALPSLAAYGIAVALGNPAQAATVAFTTLVATQLSQTLALALGRSARNWAVLGAACASLGFLGATITIPWLRTLLVLAPPSGTVIALTAAAALAAPIINGLATTLARQALPVPSGSSAQPAFAPVV